MPPALGDCVKTGDASCSTPVTGGGGGSGPGGGDSGVSDSGVLVDGSTCGVAESEIGVTNTTCIPCIETSCCGADTACSGQPACLALLQCMVACAPSDPTCPGSCENQNPTGITAYNDFASCLSSSCTAPECPTLPTGSISDF